MQKLLWAALGLAVMLPANAEVGPCNAYGPNEHKSPVTAETPLSLNSVLSEIRLASPEVRASGLEIQARSADATQAGRRLNPALSVELEEFSGSGPLTGFDRAETTIAIEQTVRLGGKRQRAQAAARALTALASAECAVILREVELQGTVLFFEYVAALEDAELLEEAAETSEKLAETVRRRVAAGAAPPPEQSRADSATASARADAVFAWGLVEQRRYALAAIWGQSDPLFNTAIVEDSVVGALADPGNRSLHPQVRRAAASAAASRAAADVERAEAMPNVTFTAGMRRFEETGDSAIVAGVSVPLPLFDRNRDSARAADLRAQASQMNRAAVEARLLAEQRAAIAAVTAARQRLSLLEDTALPNAIAAFEASMHGYAVGKFDLTTTIDARSALIDTQRAVLDAKTTLRIETARLKSLIGDTPFSGE
ncbi:TolC family protein [Hyphomonas oceanitis]|uniref:TolC family protein n=1 Tax=Hyphomonas oceanitis TaxID=81033 RepID=UPI000557BAC3